MLAEPSGFSATAECKYVSEGSRRGLREERAMCDKVIPETAVGGQRPRRETLARTSTAFRIGGRDRWPTALALAFAALALGVALQLSDGELNAQALLWLTAALAGSVVGVIAPRGGRFAGKRAVMVFLAIALALQFGQLLARAPGVYLTPAWPGGCGPFIAGIAAAGMFAALGAWGTTRVRRLWFSLLLMIHFLLGVWIIRNSPSPAIDVFVFQQESSAALLRGENPYKLTFANIYGDLPLYPPDLVRGGRLEFGFPYPPLSLFLALPGFWLGGDYRYAQLVALILSALLMGHMRPGQMGRLVATLFLFTPRVFFVLEQGWTEPFAVLLLAAAIFCACRWSRALPIAFGLLLAIKQTMVFTILALPLLLHRRRYRDRPSRVLGLSGAVALSVSLPLAAWDIAAFVHSAITLQFHQPFRADALAYTAWLAHGNVPPSWLAFVVVIPAAALALWRSPRTPAGFAAAIAIIFFCFFAFNKQAFCNYYFFVLGALCCAVAATGSGCSQSLSETTPRRFLWRKDTREYHGGMSE